MSEPLLWADAARQAALWAGRWAKEAAGLARADGPPLRWLHALTGRAHAAEGPPAGLGAEPWLPVKAAALTMQDVLHPIHSTLQLAPNDFNRLVGGPTPLASMLTGGLLGAGGGYLAGAALGRPLADLGVLDRPRRLRRSLAVLGGLAGLVPGLALGGLGMRYRALQGQEPWGAWTSPNELFKASAAADAAGAADGGPPVTTVELLGALADELAERGGVLPGHVKAAGGLAGGDFFVPTIPVDRFGRELWSDPLTPPPLRAAASGLVESAGYQAASDLVSPFDVARIAVGAGAGYLSGALVGRALGALAGLSPEAQDRLKQVGLWSGVVRAVVPKAFGF
jgi:hypothetical protein